MKFTGRGPGEFALPQPEKRTRYLVDAWAGVIHPSFVVYGVTETDGALREKYLGHWGAPRWAPHQCVWNTGSYTGIRIAAAAGQRVGRWALRFREPASTAEELGDAQEGKVTRVFRNTLGAASEFSVEFGEAGGMLAAYSLDGWGKDVLLKHEGGRFRGTVKLPPDRLLAVETAWGDGGVMTPWVLRRKG